MIDIVLTILAFNILIIIFKFFDKLKIDNLQALIVNYITAGFCALLFTKQSIVVSEVLHSDFIYHAIAIGFLFIIVFNFYATGTQKVGIAITTVANKLSLFIPVAVAIIIYPNEKISLSKLIAFGLAAISIYLSSTKNKKLNFDKKYLWLIILVFVGQGVADSIFNHAQQTAVNDNEKTLFFIVLFMMAGLSGLVILLFKSIKSKLKLSIKNVIGGIALGIPNYASLVFFFNALESSGLEASQVFPVVSMGVIVISAIVGKLLFKEHLSLYNWLGLGIAIIAIFIITFA
ncbi:EamA/RhaT family transporter [Vicingus serpentipes]|uniref:EamA/RhaT family transporter n=1 Tax=Vicingus serpentipes TaxID=1926625 RepID=A0A5C6RTK8_9FLAO|nr:EamA/RhaT family transporter [Vicingus serpentipes]TXB65294.1 EamA/RhaT family transporter [Vicingus serpentipes]